MRSLYYQGGSLSHIRRGRSLEYVGSLPRVGSAGTLPSNLNGTYRQDCPTPPLNSSCRQARNGAGRAGEGRFPLPTRTPEASEPASRYHSLFGQRDFTFLWWSQVAHWSGDAAYAIGILWIMQEMTGSTAMMGLVGALRAAPSALGLVTGVLVDRWRPRNVLVGATFARAVIVVSVPLLWGLQVLKPWHLLVIAVLQGCTGIFLMPSRNALMPAVVPGDRLIQANALMMFSAQVISPTLC